MQAGNLTITSNQIIFEPSLSDPLVRKLGLLRLTVVLEMNSLLSCTSPCCVLVYIYAQVSFYRTRTHLSQKMKASLRL